MPMQMVRLVSELRYHETALPMGSWMIPGLLLNGNGVTCTCRL